MVRLELLAVAALLLVLCHIGSYGTCDAYSAATGLSGASTGAKLDTTAAGAPASGETYRPPIINMKYFGGPVMWKPIRLYFVWYGTWTQAEKNLIRAASKSLTPNKKILQYPNLANYWSVVTKYYQQLPGEGKKFASNAVSIAGEVDDNYSFGFIINANNDPINIILSHVGQGRAFPSDLEQGVYFLFTSRDMVFSDNPKYCGYHFWQCVDPVNTDCNNHLSNIIYSFVPLISNINCNVFNSAALTGTPPNYHVAPSGDLDSMIKTYLHELTELVVDPYPHTSGIQTGWRVNLIENSETADLCSYSWVAGDWYYCGLPGVYPDFPGARPGGQRCGSLFEPGHHNALTEPKTQTTFNLYGIDGTQFLAQQFWSLGNKGCVLQLEEASCAGTTVVLSTPTGTIQRGLFFNGIGLQRYAPGQTCTWKIIVAKAKVLNLSFDKVALGYDALDSVTVTHGNVVIKKVTKFGNNIKVTVTGNTADIRFVSYGGRSPYPSAAGFIMRYAAGF